MAEIYIFPDRTGRTWLPMIALDVELGAVRIHTGQRQKPYIFRVANSILWSLLAKLAASGNLTIPQLPSGLQLDFSAAQDGSNAEIRIMPGQL